MNHLVTATIFLIALAQGGCAKMLDGFGSDGRLDRNMGDDTYRAGEEDDGDEQSKGTTGGTGAGAGAGGNGGGGSGAETSRVWATLDAAFNVGSAVTGTLLKFDNILEDLGGEWNKSQGIFVSRRGGRYKVDAQLTLDGPWAEGEFCKLIISKSKSGPISVNQAAPTSPGGTCSLHGGITVTLSANQAIAVYAISAGGAAHTTYPTQYNPYNYVTIQGVPAH